MSEFENKGDKSASENAKALKYDHVQNEISEREKVEKQRSTWPTSKDP